MQARQEHKSQRGKKGSNKWLGGLFAQGVKKGKDDEAKKAEVAEASSGSDAGSYSGSDSDSGDSGSSDDGSGDGSDDDSGSDSGSDSDSGGYVYTEE